MKYDRIDGHNKQISRLIFGCCNRTLIAGGNDAMKILDDAYETGFTAFDTARVYGGAENSLGEWMALSGLRDQITVITKGCHPDHSSRLNVEALQRDIDTSLRELKTDYIDVYLLHRDDPEADIESVLASLDDYVRKGVIRKIGVSNWTHDRIQKVNDMAAQTGLTSFSISSPQYSPVRQIGDPWGGCVSISYDDEAIEWYRAHPEITVFSYSSLAHGFLSGKVRSRFSAIYKSKLDGATVQGYWYAENLKKLRIIERMAKTRRVTVPQLSIAAILNQDIHVFPVLTSSSKNNMIKNIEALDLTLSQGELEKLWVQ